MSSKYLNNLRLIRKNHPDKQLRSGTKIAKIMGISEQHYYGLERGEKRLNSDHLKMLSNVFGITTNEILGEGYTQTTSDEELNLITCYRRLSEKEKNLINTMLQTMLEN